MMNEKVKNHLPAKASSSSDGGVRTIKLQNILSSHLSYLKLLLLLLLATSCLFSAQAKHLHKHHKVAHEKTTNTTTTSSSSSTDSITGRRDGKIKVPSLYNDDIWSEPIQGQVNLDKIVLRANVSQHSNESTINLIQYYMATCPDCQGFSPYFKRFSADIGPHWRHLVRIYTVNCNDDQNINVCWQQNPNLTVPLVRWYSFPAIQADRKKFNYPIDLLNVEHRQYIPKARRDLISLRHATLSYILSVLDHLASSDEEKARGFYSKLPLSWKLLRPLAHRLNNTSSDNKQTATGRESSETKPEVSQFLLEINERFKECSKDGGDKKIKRIENFILFEKAGSYVGKTLVADWSNWTDCSIHNDMTFMFHFSNNLNLIDFKSNDSTDIDHRGDESSKGIKLEELFRKRKNGTEIFPMLFSFASSPAGELKDLPKFKLLSYNETGMNSESDDSRRLSISRSKRHMLDRRLDQHNQKLSIEQYYLKRKLLDQQQNDRILNPNQPGDFKYTQLMRASIFDSEPTRRQIRARRADNNNNNNNKSNINFYEAENINWGPEYLYPGEESIRYKFNNIIAKEMKSLLNIKDLPEIAGKILSGKNADEIMRPVDNGTNKVIPPEEDDLTALRLTDYYKSLDEIVHKNILQKANIDAYQLVSTTCFINHLSRYFPFQGLNPLISLDINTTGSHHSNSNNNHHNHNHHHHHHHRQHQGKSIARNYLELLYQKFSDLLNKRNIPFSGCTNSPLPVWNKTSIEQFKATSKELLEIQEEVKKKHDVGLPSEAHFKWSYCAGSREFLRGHTCSLWILFHTLTVNEYLKTKDEPKQVAANCSKVDDTNEEGEQYRFKIKYSDNNKTKCDPDNPEKSFTRSNTSELFVEQTQFIISNIINFVRYYLPCTNCASHFSCMVYNSPGLNLCNPKPEDHLLWLWESHNRVNVRTRSTHSEDPIRPKHVFPVYNACPECYLEQPNNGTAFEEMKFNKKNLVEFIVARYKKSAILNNKIKIEDLFRKKP